MSDILGNFSKKSSAEGAANAAPATTAQTTSTQGELDRGTNLLNKVAAKGSESSTTQASANNSTASSEGEPSGTETTVSSSDDWTKDSALKEVKKLREENKTVRLKYQEQIEKIKSEQEARAQAQQDELVRLKKAQEELDKIKSEQEDKKRDLSEKVAHREARLAELQAISTAKEQEFQKKISDMENIVRQYQAEKAAESEVYKNRISEELNKIPEKFRDYANLIVKGSGDPRDALLALNEAKLKGMFEEKTVIVNHSVPGAKDGARSTKERLEEGDRERRNTMNSSQKIKSGLESIRSGTPNSVFRMK
jgi:chromosome segregation ATPase